MDRVQQWPREAKKKNNNKKTKQKHRENSCFSSWRHLAAASTEARFKLIFFLCSSAPIFYFLFLFIEQIAIDTFD